MKEIMIIKEPEISCRLVFGSTSSGGSGRGFGLHLKPKARVGARGLGLRKLS